ncbi:MAG: hypothetical protein JO021_01580 [Alphaproteobacteria bacterium]|nr:hypothetical protein [Alphaproteobacteria bacterium]
MPTRRAVLVGAALSLVAAPTGAGGAPFYYKAWRFNTSAVPNQLSASLTRSLEAQIDLVEALPLRPEVLRFFRDVDVKVDPATLGKAAFYRTAKQRSARSARMASERAASQEMKTRPGATVHRIYLSTQPVPPDQPLLLTMLLHALFDRRLADADVARVEAWFDEAKRTGAFANRSEMMHGPEAFFANGAGAVLYGRWPEEPFERAKMRDRLPDFTAWVVSEFVADDATLQ